MPTDPMPTEMPPSPEPGRHVSPTFAQALGVWAKIGCLSFGGPAGQIALMHKELVETRRWISETRFLNALNYCMLLPGPEAQQLATYIGWLLHGTRGGLVAGTLFVAPGFVVILTLSILYTEFHQTDWLGHVFFGLKAAVIAIVIEAVIKVARRALKSRAMLAIAAASFMAIYGFDVPFPAIIVVAALVGTIGKHYDLPGFRTRTAAAATTVIDRAPDASGPHRALPGWGRALRIIATWVSIWLAPIALFALVPGPDHGLVVIGAFFAKLAVFTFGGAYAALAYVADVAVTGFHWLRPGEMLDGLALAETTPGPLLMVLTFVGFEAAYRLPAPFGGLASGILGAGLVTWLTFVPSFLWIFLGGPYVERLRGQPLLTGALAGITAAVVGVILNLAAWFALHTLFYDLTLITLGPLRLTWPLWSTLDLKAAALAAIAVGLLFRAKLGVVPTLAISGALGFLLKSIA
jgi:chromate transporter